MDGVGPLGVDAVAALGGKGGAAVTADVGEDGSVATFDAAVAVGVDEDAGPCNTIGWTLSDATTSGAAAPVISAAVEGPIAGADSVSSVGGDGGLAGVVPIGSDGAAVVMLSAGDPAPEDGEAGVAKAITITGGVASVCVCVCVCVGVCGALAFFSEPAFAEASLRPLSVWVAAAALSCASMLVCDDGAIIAAAGATAVRGGVDGAAAFGEALVTGVDLNPAFAVTSAVVAAVSASDAVSLDTGGGVAVPASAAPCCACVRTLRSATGKAEAVVGGPTPSSVSAVCGSIAVPRRPPVLMGMVETAAVAAVGLAPLAVGLALSGAWALSIKPAKADTDAKATPPRAEPPNAPGAAAVWLVRTASEAGMTIGEKSSVRDARVRQLRSNRRANPRFHSNPLFFGQKLHQLTNPCQRRHGVSCRQAATKLPGRGSGAAFAPDEARTFYRRCGVYEKQ